MGLRGVVLVAAMASCAPLTDAFMGIPSFLEFGSCADVTLKENFDPVKYSGLWFDIETVPNEYQHTKKCVTQNYTWTGEQMDVATRGLTVDDTKVRQSAVMLRDDGMDNPASMLVQAAGVPEAPYQIIDTDYRTYSCVYSCLDGYAGFRAEFMWVFSRTPTLSPSRIKYCNDIFTSMDIIPEKMVPVVQEHPCPYFEKLDQMLAESRQHILKVVGPPEPSTPSPIPTSPPSTTQPPTTTHDNVMHDLMDVVQEEREILEDLKHDLEFSSRSHNLPSGSNSSRIHHPTGRGRAGGVPVHGSSVREVNQADPNTSSTSVPAMSLLLLFITVLLQM